jgi:hypothetical protein
MDCWGIKVKNPNCVEPYGRPWQIHTDRYTSDQEPTLTVFQESRHSSKWLVSVRGEFIGTIYHVIPRNWVTVLDASGNWVASVLGGYAGREAAISLLVSRQLNQ